MAISPQLKIYNTVGEYVASCKHHEDAAAIIGVYGNGAIVRFGHKRKNVLWTEGKEEFSVKSSYDQAATVMRQREEKFKRRATLR